MTVIGDVAASDIIKRSCTKRVIIALSFSFSYLVAMDTRQLETFLAITQQGGFAAAARAVNLTASAVSQQIAALEAEVGAGAI